MSNLSICGKRLLVVGGNGYLGALISNAASSLGTKVTAVTKSGINRNQHANTQINFVAGEATNPRTFENHLQEADVVVNSFGIITDILGKRLHLQAAEGHCEGLNRNSAREIGNILGRIGGKKYVHLSIMKDSSVTKQTEDMLFQQSNMKMCLLRLGLLNVLNDSKYFKASEHSKLALRKAVQTFTSNNPFASEISNLSTFENCNDVDNVVKATIYAAFSNKYDGKIIESRDISKIVEENQTAEEFKTEKQIRGQTQSDPAII